MKTSKPFAIAVLALLGITAAHAEKIIAGPKGGRLLNAEPPRAEFFVEKDRTVTVTFYDANLKPLPAAEHSALVIAEAESGKARIALEKSGEVLTSKTPLPEGQGYTVVIQLKASPDARPQNYRLVLNTEHCGGCNLAEYACTCGH